MPRFTPLEYLGQGATGIVQKALDTTANISVALKMPSPEVQGEELARFTQAYEAEAACLRTLDHPGLLRLVDQGVEGGRPFIAYEYLQGQPLRAVLAAGKRLPVHQVARLLDSLLEGLEYLHGQGWVHRDVNPNNLYLLADGAGGLKLLDFGAAARIGDPPGALIGTPQYMAPEQLQGGPPDPRSDLFSVGVVAYELLTGQPPFVGHTFPELVQIISAGQYTPVRSLMPELSEEAERVLRTALATDPARRYQSAAAMRTVLIHALEGGPTEAPPPISTAAVPDTEARPTMISGIPVQVESGVLVAVEGPYTGQQFPLSGGITTLGGAYADLNLSRDLGIAAQHCWIIHEGDRYLLHDADESGGTRLNGSYIRRAPLLEGDLIQIGGSVFRFQDPHQPLGANRPQGSVEYAPLPPDAQRHKQQVAAMTAPPPGGPRSPGWAGPLLVMFVLLIGVALGMAALIVPPGIQQSMTLQLNPVWGYLDPVLKARDPGEFFSRLDNYDPPTQQGLLAMAQPVYPVWLAWLPPVKSAVEESYRMREFLIAINDGLLTAHKQASNRSQFTPETITALDQALREVRQINFTSPPWPGYHSRATAGLTHLTALSALPATPEMSGHPVLQALPAFQSGLRAFTEGDWSRAYTLLNEALVVVDRWYSSSTDEEQAVRLSSELYPAGDAAMALMAVCEIRQAQIRLLHQPADTLTENDLRTIRGWVRDAESLLRRIAHADLARLLQGFRAGFAPEYDPRTLAADMDALYQELDRRMARATASPLPGN